MHENKTTEKITSKDIHHVGYKTLFSEDKYLMYVHKKSHSISRAIYLITDFFNDSEPIKLKMRQTATDLIEQVLSLSVELSPSRKSLLDGILKSCLSLLSYSEIAMFSGIESQMNHTIISSEIENLMSIIEGREVPSRLGRHFVLDHSLFVKDSLSAHTPHPAHTTSQGSRHASIPIPTPSLNMVRTTETMTKFDHSDERKIQRRQAILSIIRAKGLSSIKDITDVIKDCSEKTIQRELLDLVGANVLKKEGDRRWTRYSLV
jgi:hypothetical protein